MLFPWSGFFELVASTDVFVHLDDVQFSKGGFTNRIQIKHQSGSKWLTIPLRGKGQFQKISDLAAVGADWKDTHRDLVRQSLAAAPYLASALDLLDSAYAREPLIELLIASIEVTTNKLALNGPKRWERSSELAVDGSSWERVLSIVKAVGGTRYLTAHGAANYLNHAAFDDAGIAVEYMDYSKTIYRQLHGDFTPFVSILDIIANLGPDARNVISPKTVPWRTFLGAMNGDGLLGIPPAQNGSQTHDV
jgi:hypothetical protein